MPRANAGDETINAYDGAADRYIAAHSPASGDVLAWLDRFEDLLPAGGRVLEIGSGPGTDADLLEARGLVVQRSDATRAFADRLRAAGHDVLDLDVRRDPLPGGQDGVLANAVLLHLGRDEIPSALERIRDALRPGGVLACSLKEGDGKEVHTRKLGLPRRFTYWRPGPLRAALEGAGFEVLRLDRSAGPTDDWLQVLARR